MLEFGLIRNLLITALAVCYAACACAADISFDKQIAPVLEARCIGCHNSEKSEGELDLTTRKGLLDGGEEGLAIVPGKPDESRLIRQISGAKPKMPKEGKPLTPEQIAALQQWIAEGAKWSDGVQLKRKNISGPDFWAYQPVVRPKVPDTASQTAHTKWARTPIDAFVLDKLQRKNMAPVGEIDRRTLLRRATYDLHGLPPTPEELDAFVNDAAPDAYEKVLDRLLASPRYGERWGRHWLDAVHYGDTHGYDKDHRRNNAWPYRDYVIRSFNTDKPYSQFIKEQLAGDIFWPDTEEGIVATGFIAAGPWDQVGQTELKEGSIDKEITRVLDRDDMVANTASTFLSMTVYCARCHDHKFDPIPQRDYYRMQAVFAGLDRADRSFNETRQQRQARATFETRRAEVTRQREALVKKINEKKLPELNPLDEELRVLNQELAVLTLPQGEAVSRTNGWHSQISATKENKKWVQVDLGRPLPLDEIRLIPARPVDFPDTPGFGFPVRFKIEISDDAEFFLAETIDDKTQADFANPGDVSYMVRPNSKTARFVRVTATHLWPRTNDWVFALGELQVASGGRNAALMATVNAFDTIEAGRWSTKHLVDGYNSRVRLASYPEAAAPAGETEEARKARTERAGAALKQKIKEKEAERQALARTLVSGDDRAALETIEREAGDVEAGLKALPAPKLVYALVPREPRKIRVLHRGEVQQPQDEVGPGGLTLVRALAPEFKVPNAADEGQRRAALAEWIADPRNVLTRRSIMNRIWHHHFGKGIVDTPNDFGFNGGRPTHPELLDWLAVEFLESGESFKKMHKLIMTSSVYRQACATNAEFEKVDADNRLLWRANRRRLDAESIRDSILLLSGKLDPAMYGPGYDLFRYKHDHSPTYDYTAFAKEEHPETWRRTVYRFSVRSVANPFLDCLDCADPNLNVAVRTTTNTALQALAVLNDPFVIRQSRYLAERIEKLSADKAAQIQQLYRIVLNRLPLADEQQALQDHAAQHGLANACRLLLNTNEFMFVE